MPAILLVMALMSHENETLQRTIQYLETKVSENGVTYVQAKNIGGDIGEKAKSVGKALATLRENPPESTSITVDKWGRSKATTWRVDPE